MRRALTGCALAAILATLIPVGASAAPTGDPQVQLTAQAPTVALGTDLTYSVTVTNAPADLQLRTTVFDRVTSRSTFERIIDGTQTGGALSQVTTAITTPANQTVTVPLIGSSTEGRSLNVTQVGVYPLRIDLVQGGTSVGEPVTTFLVTVPADAPPVNEPLTVATIIPVVDAPAFDASGRPEPAAIAARQPAGRLGRLAAGLAAVPATPVTVDLGGETLQAWAELAKGDPTIGDTFTRFRNAIGSRQRVASTFVPIDAPALHAANLDPTANDEFARGATAASDALDQRVDPRTARINPIDDATLRLLATRGVDQLVLAPDALRPIPTRLTPARPFLVDAPDRQLRAVTTDPGLTRAATSSTSPAVNAQRVLAGLALITLEAPNLARGVAFALPSDLDAPTAFYADLLAGLASSAYLRPSTLDRLFTDIPVDATSAGPLVRTLTPITPAATTVTRAEIDRSADRTAGLATLVGPTDPRLRRARNALLIAPTSLWSGTEGQRRARDELNAVDASIATAGERIRIPENRTFQLTGRRDNIPLTFVNESDQPVEIRITFDSTRIDFPNGTSQIVRLPARKSTTISVAVAPRTSGTYPFRLTVDTVVGNVRLARTTMTVNATGVSGVGYFLAIGAALFLAAWWVHYVWKRRRKQSPPPEPAAAPEPAERSA